jgi:DNA (cytosine-5)-methyltransferase 1
MTYKIEKMTNSSSEITKAVELFCGIGGFRLACDSLGIRTIWANDINRLSCMVYADVFGQKEIHEGDIRDLHGGIPSHNLLTAGFPCQPFSSAGKKQGIRDPRGTLFQEIVQVIQDHAPSHFVLENVKRLLSMENGDHFATILTALSELDYFVEWRLLNATNFGLAQNRERVVIVGTHIQDIEQAGIVLAPIDDLADILRHDAGTLKSQPHWKPLDHHKKRFPSWGLCYKDKCYSCDLDLFSEATPAPVLSDFLEASPEEDFFMDTTTNERIKDSVFVNRVVDGVRILFNQNGGARMGYTVFGIDGVAPALTASHSRHYERYKIGDRYRRLTNREYARLQGFPDNHCRVASVFDQYGLYGNAVPPPLAQWVIDRVIDGKGHSLQSLQLPKDSQLVLFV